MRVTIPDGLPSDRSIALDSLVSEITGELVTGPLPLAPALLFSDPVLKAALALPDPGPGRLLVHDYQGLDIAPPLTLDVPLEAIGETGFGGEAAEFRVRLGRPGDPPVAELRTGLRLVAGQELAGAAGLTMRAAPAPDWRDERTVKGAQIARYCAVSGDDNPLHLDRDYVAASGLPAPPVPGLLLLSLFHPGCAALSQQPVTSLKARFMAPIYQDETIALSLTHRGAATDGGLRVRGFVWRPDGSAGAIADFVLGGPANRTF